MCMAISFAKLLSINPLEYNNIFSKWITYNPAWLLQQNIVSSHGHKNFLNQQQKIIHKKKNNNNKKETSIFIQLKRERERERDKDNRNLRNLLVILVLNIQRSLTFPPNDTSPYYLRKTMKFNVDTELIVSQILLQ